VRKDYAGYYQEVKALDTEVDAKWAATIAPENWRYFPRQNMLTGLRKIFHKGSRQKRAN